MSKAKGRVWNDRVALELSRIEQKSKVKIRSAKRRQQQKAATEKTT
jgi:hypothetical protein